MAERFTLQAYFTPSQGKTLRRFPKLVAAAFAIVRRAAPRQLRVCVALQAMMAGALALQLLLLRELLTALVGGGAGTFGAVLPEIAGLTALGAAAAAAGAFLEVRTRLLSQYTTLHTTEGVIRTATGVDLITFDAPGFHDRLQRAYLAASSRPSAMVQALIGAAGAALAIVAVVVALLLIQPLFCMLVLLAYVPTWIATNRASRLVYRATVAQTERERRRQYLFELLTSKPSAQEVRAFDAGGFLGERQRTIYVELLEELKGVLYRRLRIALTGHALTSLLTAGALALLVWFVTTERMSLAEAGAAAGAMVLLTGRLRGLAGSAASLYDSSLYLEDYTTFVAAAPRIAADRPTVPLAGPPDVLRAESVSFTYPSRSEPSLVDATLELRRGEVVALVGENGSGKTTLAKLLSGLYTPSPGIVTYDGVDIATLDPDSVRAEVAVIFQDFVRYLLPAHDNIGIGDHAHFEDRAAIERAARAAGIHDAIAGFEDGYDTILGPEYYGGSDLSGGQWQRVALARLFFRDAPVVILDEPTAALDPRAEAELYASMRSLFANRGVLLISHRFGSARTADRIYVLRDGRVHEQGTHDELMEADGYYAELFRLQASQYR